MEKTVKQLSAPPLKDELDLRMNTVYYEYPAPAEKTFTEKLHRVIDSEREVGIESSLTLALKKVLPGKTIVADLVDEARLVETGYEIGRTAYAATVVEGGMKKALELCL